MRSHTTSISLMSSSLTRSSSGKGIGFGYWGLAIEHAILHFFQRDVRALDFYLGVILQDALSV